MSLTLYAGRTLTSAPDTAAEAFVPPDGHHQIMVEGSRRAVQLEWAHLTGARVFSGGPIEFTGLHMPFEEASQAQFLRLAIQSYSPAEQWQTPHERLLARSDSGLWTHVEVAPDGARYYDDPLLTLAPDVADGSRWTSQGAIRSLAGGQFRSGSYTARLTAADAGTGCLIVTNELAIAIEGTALVTEESSTTWCTGRGIVGLSDDGRSLTAVDTWPDFADPRKQVGTKDPVLPDSIESWTLTNGQQSAQFTAVPITYPALVHPTIFLSPTGTTGDVIAMGVNEEVALGLWRGHPGGTIVSTGAFGEVIVVTTSERTLVAYTATGLRLWSATGPDAAPSRLTRVSDDTFAATFLDGSVIVFDIATGEQVWSASLDVEIRLPAVRTGDVLFVMDNAGNGVAFDPETGRPLWEYGTENSPEAMIGCGDQIVYRDSYYPSVVSIDTSSGEQRWSTNYREATGSMACLGDQVVLAAPAELQSIGLDGSKRWRLERPVWANILSVGGMIVTASTSQVAFVDHTGAIRSEWPVTFKHGAASSFAVPGPDSFLVVDSLGGYVLGGPGR